MEQALQGKAIEREWSIAKGELGFEFMMNALRLIDGVPLGLFQQRTGLALNELNAKIREAQQKGLLLIENGTIKPSFLGQRFLNELLALFLD
jgi:oxygen-independent coproporphyrinogen-3 oxidase